MLPAWCAQWSPLAMIWGMARRLAAGGRKAARVLAWIAGQSLWCRSYWTGRGKSVGRICLGCMHARFPACWASEIGLLLGWRVPALPPRSDLGGQHGVDVSEVDAAAQQSHVARTDEMRLAYEARARMLVNASHWIGGMLQIMIVLFLAASTMALARARSLRFDLCVLGVSLVPAMALIVLHGVFFEVQARYAFPVWVLPLFS